jgi:diguanylate cyclase (GGDEF)-like protein/PAS domain S-box-containing protein
VKLMGGKIEDQLLGRNTADFRDPAQEQRAMANITAMFEGVYNGAEEYRLVCLDGSVIDTEINAEIVRDDQGRPSGLIFVVRDIRARKLAELDLHIAAIAFESQDGMIVTDAQSTILRANHAFTQITGYQPEEVIGKTPRMLQSGRHDADFYAALWATIQTSGVWSGEIWNRRKNGDIYPEQITITAVKDSTGQITHYVAVLRDITVRKQLEKEVAQLAFFDTLTQLPNRRLFNDRLTQSVARAQREQSSLALMFIDLDKFKPINDTYGHEAGDLVLQTVARRIESALRASDTAARVGGDEFLVLLPDLQTSADALAVAEKIRLALEQPFVTPEGVPLLASASIGVAIFPDHAQTEQDLLRLGDGAMYEAKNAGGNSVRMCALLAESDGHG